MTYEDRCSFAVTDKASSCSTTRLWPRMRSIPACY